ncbi:MAG: hypothetical protein ACR2QF_06230 [Geminicoccaceae bacterium]
MEKAQRRIERLLGERNQLSALLDKRDEQIQHLYRELGSRGSTNSEVKVPKNAPSSWLNTLTTLGTKILSGNGAVQLQHGLENAAKQPMEETKEALSNGFKRPPLLANHKTAAPKAVLAVLLFGLDEDQIKNLLPVIERDCQASDMMPLLLTDNDAFELLREHDLIFEYLPPDEDRRQFDLELSWNLYIQRRLAIIRQKWQPARVIALGQVAADMLKLWQQSPFEEIPIPAAMKA